MGEGEGAGGSCLCELFLYPIFGQLFEKLQLLGRYLNFLDFFLESVSWEGEECLWELFLYNTFGQLTHGGK